MDEPQIGKHWSQKVAIVLGAISAPVAFGALLFGLIAAEKSLNSAVLMIATIIHTPVAVLYFFTGRRTPRTVWLIALMTMAVTSVVDAINIEREQQAYIAKQVKMCKEYK